eukprot:11462814-Alexandrium_andersonii.AAC.1
MVERERERKRARGREGARSSFEHSLGRGRPRRRLGAATRQQSFRTLPRQRVRVSLRPGRPRRRA